MKDDDLIMIPLVSKENSDARLFKIIKLLVVLLIITNLMWLGSWGIYWLSPCTMENVTQESEGEGICNYIGEGGEIYD